MCKILFPASQNTHFQVLREERLAGVGGVVAGNSFIGLILIPTLNELYIHESVNHNEISFSMYVYRTL